MVSKNGGELNTLVPMAAKTLPPAKAQLSGPLHYAQKNLIIFHAFPLQNGFVPSDQLCTH